MLAVKIRSNSLCAKMYMMHVYAKPQVPKLCCCLVLLSFTSTPTLHKAFDIVMAIKLERDGVAATTGGSLDTSNRRPIDLNNNLRCVLARHPPNMALRASLDRCPPAPTEATDQDLHWLAHRIPCQTYVHNSYDYRVVKHLCPERRPQSPRPDAHLYCRPRAPSKRRWEKMAMAWRASLADLAEEVVAVMSAVATVRWLGGPEVYPGYILNIPIGDLSEQ